MWMAASPSRRFDPPRVPDRDAHRRACAFCISAEGEADWNLVIRRLADVGYDGALSVELKDHHSRATPELQREGLLRSKGFIEQFLREK